MKSGLVSRLPPRCLHTLLVVFDLFSFFYVLICSGVILNGQLDGFAGVFVENQMLFKISTNLS